MSEEMKQADGLRKRKTSVEENSSVVVDNEPKLLDDGIKSYYEFVEEENSSTSEFTSRDAEKQKPMFLFYTREIAKHFGREEFLITSLREAVVYSVFLVNLFIVTCGHSNTSLLHYTQAMDSLFTKTTFKQDLTQDDRQAIRNFENINTIEEVLSFLEYALSVFSYDVDKKGVKRQRDLTMEENRLLGCLRLRQVRVRNDSCKMDSNFRMMFKGCYGPYKRSNEETHPYGLGRGTAWNYSSRADLGLRAYAGVFATYGGGGYYIDFSGNMTETLAWIEDMNKHIWIDRATRAVFLDFTTYNANVNLFCTTKLVMEFSPSGGVVPKSRIHVQKLIRFHSSFDYVLLLNHVLFFAFCAYYLCEEMYEINYFRWNYVTSFWNWIDLVLIVIMRDFGHEKSGCERIYCNNLYKSLYINASMDITHHVRVVVELPELVTKTDIFPNFENICHRRPFYNTLRAVSILLAWLKLIKYLTIFSTMYELQVTIRKAAVDLAYYTVIFMTVFITFVSLGQLLFGSSVENFHTFEHSFFTLLHSVTGDFNYDEIEDRSYFLSSIFFTGFIVIILFIFINMYAAILVDTFAEVRTRLVFEAETSEIQTSIGDILNKWYIMTLHKLKMHRQAENREKEIKVSKAKACYGYLRNLLHRCGYSELDIDIYFQKHGISQDKEMSQEDIKAFLTGIGSSVIRGPHTAEGLLIHEHQILYDNMNERVTNLEDAIVSANNKVAIIIIKLDAIQQIQMARMSN